MEGVPIFLGFGEGVDNGFQGDNWTLKKEAGCREKAVQEFTSSASHSTERKLRGGQGVCP